jgi:hypothetical protein
MTIEKIKQQLQRANEAAAKLEADKEDLTSVGNWALGYWQGQISILESLLKEI